MTYLMPVETPVAPSLADPNPVVRDREGTLMLLHEALARSRQQEAEQAAREHALVRSVTAGRRWAGLARFASRRAERARAGTAARSV
jgi:hypothetical protein